MSEQFEGMSNFEIVMLMKMCAVSRDESDKQFVKDCAKELAIRKPTKAPTTGPGERG